MVQPGLVHLGWGAPGHHPSLSARRQSDQAGDWSPCLPQWNIRPQDPLCWWVSDWNYVFFSLRLLCFLTQGNCMYIRTSTLGALLMRLTTRLWGCPRQHWGWDFDLDFASHDVTTGSWRCTCHGAQVFFFAFHFCIRRKRVSAWRMMARWRILLLPGTPVMPNR